MEEGDGQKRFRAPAVTDNKNKLIVILHGVVLPLLASKVVVSAVSRVEPPVQDRCDQPHTQL